LRTGFVETGKDMGSGDYSLVRRPKVIVMSGNEVSPLNLGEIWHFFEEELDYPVDLVNMDHIDGVSLDAYNVFILPEGYYTLEEEMLGKINTWVSAGGRLVVVGSAVNKVAGKEGFGIESKSAVEPDSVKQDYIVHTPDAYNTGDRKVLSDEIPGTIFQTTLDRTHPLTSGLGDAYWSLKTSTASFKWLKDGGNAIYLDDTPLYYGFAGYKALEKTRKTLIAGQEKRGAGSVVYLVDNPLFRSFWNSGKVLFSNALFF
jgi:hypothetical protein